MSSTVATRFAPSPTGWLHRGHAWSAGLNQLLTSAGDGRFHLRFDDLDTARCTPDFEVAASEDLAWLGIEPDGAPIRQSDRRALYDDALASLQELGVLHRSADRPPDQRRVPGPAGPGPTRAPTETLALIAERDEGAGRASHAWRLSMDEAARRVGEFDVVYPELTGRGVVQRRLGNGWFDDVILWRDDGRPSYHLATVVDDALLGISHVVRGADLAPAAPLHALLGRLLGHRIPVYCHHAVLTDGQGARLSKRRGSASLRSLRDRGVYPRDLLPASLDGAWSA